MGLLDGVLDTVDTLVSPFGAAGLLGTIAGDKFGRGGGSKGMSEFERTRKPKVDQMRKSILEDENITETTRKELLGSLEGLDLGAGEFKSDPDTFTPGFEEISTLFTQAQAGEGKFGSRQATRKLLQEQSKLFDTKIVQNANQRLTSLLGE